MPPATVPRVEAWPTTRAGADKKATMLTPAVAAPRMDSSPPPPRPKAMVAPAPQTVFGLGRGELLSKLCELLPGQTIAGYRIAELIGRGAMGVVFRAIDERTSAQVAWKLLDPDLTFDPNSAARFLVEARTPQHIDSPNVVRVIHTGSWIEAWDTISLLVPAARDRMQEQHPLPFIVMELLSGTDLRDYVHERGPLPFIEVVDILGQVAKALDKAHAIGVIHRDLKPANIFLTQDSKGQVLVKVLDFGIAQVRGGPNASSRGALFGTPWYMSPEQARGEEATPASDRWALALIAFRLLTAESYWAPCPIPELLGYILGGPTSAPSREIVSRSLVTASRVGANFDAWFFQACSMKPSDRFLNAEGQIAAMRGALLSDSRASFTDL